MSELRNASKAPECHSERSGESSPLVRGKMLNRFKLEKYGLF